MTQVSQLQQLLVELRQQPVVAVDTESDSLFAYHYKVCLIQLSVPQADYLVDPLALCDVTPLGALFANPSVQKVFHAAENDILALQRDYGFTFTNIFDTLWAARILGWPNRNLAAILEARFGVKMDKRMQRTNWGRRPLTPEQLAYARLDSHYLLPLRELQMAELHARGRMAEAAEAFARLTALTWEEKPFDPDGFWRLNGARELPPRALAVLRELYLWREERARQLDRPLFKVMGDRTLLRLAEEQPADRQALRQIPGMSDYQVKRHGEGILAAIARGQRAPIPRPPAHPRNHSARFLDAAAQARYDALRAWRNAKAAERGVDPDVVLSNEELKAIAERPPKTLEELAELEIVGAWKRATYGQELLDVLVG
ncbi:MAG: HRDC domain-containing protein [Anaerolineae bacterium]|nr:HRDC domain-containing protein [Anaerolineae bacterium]